LALAAALRKAGHTTRVISFDDLGKDVPLRVAMLRFPLHVAWVIARSARTRAIDVVDATTGDTWLWSLTPSASSGPSVVCRSHGLEHIAWAHEVAATHPRLRARVFHGGVALAQVRRSLRAADAVVFLNQPDARYAVKRLGVAPDRTFVCANGLTDGFFGLPAPVAQPPGSPITLAVIGSYIERKGIADVAEALARLMPARPHLRVRYVGTRTRPETVLARHPRELWDRIEVVEHYPHSQLPQILRGCSISVLASRSEGFPLAVLEAMACGLVPIATAVPGPSEMVEDGRNGLLVPPGKPSQLAEAVARLLDNDELRLRLRLQAQEDVQRYTWDRAAAEAVEIYNQLLSARRN
jgi:glycosyltransferase involved in cell wall biosynthesis